MRKTGRISRFYSGNISISFLMEMFGRCRNIPVHLYYLRILVNWSTISRVPAVRAAPAWPQKQLDEDLNMSGGAEL